MGAPSETRSAEDGDGVSKAAALDKRVGMVLQGRYRVLSPLGAGTMGSVYKGERLQLGRPVAIKFLRSGLSGDVNLVKRFQVEALAMSRLAHPNCISVIDFGVADQPYLVMDFVQGMSLREALDGPWPAQRALLIGNQILAALAHAHAQGIIHRDIKPENVLLEAGAGLRDHVRVLDFGLAKMMDSQQALTQGLALGTPNYMAPEQMREGPIDSRVDLYAAGIVIFEMLTGKKPFDHADIGEVFRRHLQMPAPRLRQAAPKGGFSAALEEALLRAMAKSPGERFASAADMIAALEAVPEIRRVTPALGAAVRATIKRAKDGAAAAGAATADATIKDPTRAFLPDELPGGVAPPAGPGLRSVLLPLGRAFAALARAVSGVAGTRARGGLRWVLDSRRRAVVAAAAALVIAVGVAWGLSRSSRPSAAPPPAELKDEIPAKTAGGAKGAKGAKAGAKGRESEAGGAAAGAAARKPREAPAGEASAPRPPSPEVAEKLAAVNALVDKGQRDEAIKMVIELRRTSPRDPDYAATLARLYFEKRFWGAGIDAFRVAFRNDGERRKDPVLIGYVIDALGSDKFGDQASKFLREELGASAKPHVRAAAKSHKSPRVRKRAADLVRRWDCKGFFCP